MRHQRILLVEDNPDNEALTLRAFEHNNILNQVVVAQPVRLRPFRETSSHPGRRAGGSQRT